MTTIPDNRYQQSKRVTLVGAAVNAFLGTIKLIVGFAAHSHALIADGLHSYSDLLTDGLVLFASKYGSRAADVDHPYGHGRIETAATLALAMLLALVGVGIMYDALEHLFKEASKTAPHYFALIIAAISVLANEWLFRYTLRVANKIDSNLLKANAWHSRSDAGSSVIVLIGVAGSLMGFYYLDAIAAIIVGIYIVKMGWELGWSSLQELVDTAPDPKMIKEIQNTIKEISGVESIHQLRTRSMGGNILVDVHVLVAPKLSVSEGHYIGHCVHKNLVAKIKAVKDVTVHIDPEDDEEPVDCHLLPSREILIPQLTQRFAKLPGFDAIQHIVLHYLGGKIHVEVFLRKSVDKALNKQYQQAVADIKEIQTVMIFNTIS